MPALDADCFYRGNAVEVECAEMSLVGIVDSASVVIASVVAKGAGKTVTTPSTVILHDVS